MKTTIAHDLAVRHWTSWQPRDARRLRKGSAMTGDIRDCLPPIRTPRKPDVVLPRGSIDTHVHIFEPGYKLSPTRGYNPPDSTLADLKHLHATLGIDRVVFTQPSVYGTDNSAILDGMAALNAETPNRARSVVAISMDIADEELAALDALMPLFTALKVKMSIGHFAYQPAIARVAAPGFQALLELMRRGNTWMKISGANRVSATDLPPYDDVKPMAHALIEAAADRIMWGTDWPHPNKYVVNPNDGDLVDAFGDWVTDEALRRRIMVDTPASFYRF